MTVFASMAPNHHSPEIRVTCTYSISYELSGRASNCHMTILWHMAISDLIENAHIIASTWEIYPCLIQLGLIELNSGGFFACLWLLGLSVPTLFLAAKARHTWKTSASFCVLRSSDCARQWPAFQSGRHATAWIRRQTVVPGSLS